MTFKRMAIEDWFDRYQYEVEVNIGESGVKARTLADLGIDLSQVPLRYGHHRGAPELRELLAAEYPGLTPAHIGVTVGAAEAIFSIAAALVMPGERVLVEMPNFPSLYEAPLSLGCQVDYLWLRYEDQFELNLARLQEMLTPQTKLVLITHPNNPTGSAITTGQLEQVIQVVEQNGAYLLVDETYWDLSYTSPPPHAASLSPRAISVGTLSKAFGVPGLRIGWLAADPKIVDAVRAVREQVTICNSVLGEQAAVEILKKKDRLLAEWKPLILDNSQRLALWFDGHPDLEWIQPQAGVVGYPRLKTGHSAEELCRLLVGKYRTFVVPGSVFQQPEYFRIGFGIPTSELEEGLQRLTLALAEHREMVA